MGWKMNVKKEVYEFITWDTPTNSVISNIEATILNGNLQKLRFKISGSGAHGALNPGTTRGQNFELSLKNTQSNVATIKKLHEVFGDLLDFLDGKPLPEATKNDRKRMIQIRDVKTSTFGDEISQAKKAVKKRMPVSEDELLEYEYDEEDPSE
jgi:hypothetical protein